MVQERIGQRIAALRQKLGWTQQNMAERLAISRVAVSHIEADISIPGERTIALLAGLFKVSPHELVAGTTYPQGKVDRLPQIVCSYTKFEVDMALFNNDMTWAEKLIDATKREELERELSEKWKQRLEVWEDKLLDKGQKDLLEKARKKMNGFLERI